VLRNPLQQVAHVEREDTLVSDVQVKIPRRKKSGARAHGFARTAPSAAQRVAASLTSIAG